MDMQLKGLVIVALLMPIVVAADYHFRVANAQITFALTPSPNQKVLFILAGRGGDNEVPSGVPTVVDLDLATSKTLNGQETFWFDSNAVWSKDGRRLWAETASGIYEITLSEHLDQTARRIISGKTRGLAISEEHRRLAYWTIAPHSCTLTVVDLTTKLKVRE